MASIIEGKMPFKGYETYYRIVGKEYLANGKTPLLLCHGGPGSTHNSLEVLDDISDLDHRTLVYYDQIGCGLSSQADKSFYNKETWCEELQALRDYLGLSTVYLLGHSWGGMLVITYLSDCHPTGVKGAILSSTLPSSSLWRIEQHRMIRFLPDWAKAAIAKAEAENRWDDPEYLKANDLYMHLHVGGPWKASDPACLTRPKVQGKEAYVTAWGPNEYNPLGNLKDWEYLDKMRSWSLPVLITDGAEDESTPYINQLMAEAVKGSEWHIFEFSRHMSYVEEHAKYDRYVIDFMDRHDD